MWFEDYSIYALPEEKRSANRPPWERYIFGPLARYAEKNNTGKLTLDKNALEVEFIISLFIGPLLAGLLFGGVLHSILIGVSVYLATAVILGLLFWARLKYPGWV